MVEALGKTVGVIATFQALAVFITSILPGALFTFQYERENARVTAADFNERLVIFLVASAVFGVLSAPLLYQGYRMFAVTKHVEKGYPLPWWIWLIVAGYVVVPLVIGGLLGAAARKRHWIARPFAGAQPDPRGWDTLFKTPRLGGYVRLRLKDSSLDNPWVFGVWAEREPNGTKRPGSYAAGYPYPQDLYFIDTCEIDEKGEYLVESEDSQAPIRRNMAMLVRWDEVAYAEFIEL